MTDKRSLHLSPPSEIRQSLKELTRNEAEGDYKGRPLISYVSEIQNISEHAQKSGNCERVHELTRIYLIFDEWWFNKCSIIQWNSECAQKPLDVRLNTTCRPSMMGGF